jgi:hypothetical protein
MEPATVRSDPSSFIHWGSVVAGAVAAAALWFVLNSFAGALGLAVMSASSTWRDTSFVLALLSGVWMLLAALGSFALGGYIAGRMRSVWSGGPVDEVEFRDGIHGIVAWGLAILIGAFLAASVLKTSSVPSLSSPTASTAEPLLALELDRLFRSDRRPAGAPEDTAYRGEAARIITTGLGHSDMAADDRAYLVRMVAARTGLAQPDADARVTQAIAQSKQAVTRARSSAVILAFMLGASLILGAAGAWYASCEGGRHRDQGAPPLRVGRSRVAGVR